MAEQVATWLADAAILRAALGFAVLLLAIVFWTARSRAAALRRDLAARDGDIARLGARVDEEVARAREVELRAGRAETRLEERAAALTALGEERDGLNDALFDARRSVSQLETSLAELRLASEKDRERADHDIAQLRELREEMTRNFRLMADETLRVQGDAMQKRHREQLDGLLAPFRDQVDRFQTELQTRNTVMDRENARLHQQIETLHRRSEDISREAVALTRALKGEKQRQGAWGEMILTRILEDSGLLAGTHYEIQTSWRDDDGRLWRPDVLVKMPQNKLLVIDSKVSLNDYEISVNAEDEVERAAALRRHVQAIRNHINTLADKGYHRIDDASVDYVLMFIPVEGAFSEA
ncbi:MAG: DNA recombination protein RmuC, partial [Paracoccus sp. (in: a-proteobacteria)]|nr:DNA recombination protein RmuC [Paracoccus sp. (in: a-proteobacteria)]